MDIGSHDRVYESIRYKHFASIFSILSGQARRLRESQSQANQMSVNEMKEFVQQNLRDMKLQSKAVSVHIGASETITEAKG